jgi:hypothetical protein
MKKILLPALAAAVLSMSSAMAQAPTPINPPTPAKVSPDQPAPAKASPKKARKAAVKKSAAKKPAAKKPARKGKKTRKAQAH